ncbi:MAG TPA: DUF2007 domain-containing protein [Bacteroidales bacterium]|nr:DUF2007 domain-containing protein [Bacteroidales bacterium]HQQ11861.1 DUF2007 domain-containing protein [Bacteroidales bacterium]
MNSDSDLIKIYTGRGILVQILKDELAEAGIAAMIRDDFYAGALSGFGAVPDVVDLFVLAEDEEKAKPLVEAFVETNAQETEE